MAICRNNGTYLKKDCNEKDIPFLKLPNGTLKSIEYAWFREAIIKCRTKYLPRTNYQIQCSTWRDKKQVMFIHTHKVGPSKDHLVKRRQKGKAARIEISGPLIQKEYAENFNAVDKSDRDSAEYTTSIKTNQWYL